MHWTAVEQGVINWLDSREPGVTASGMWGYMPVEITGIHVELFYIVFILLPVCALQHCTEFLLPPGLMEA